MSINHVPPPPNPFDIPPNSTVLPAGTELHRIYSRRYPGNAFNPSAERLNRFSPIFRRGEVVPVLYAGESLESAIFETLLHNVAHGARRQTLRAKAIEDKCYGSWITQRAVRVATLHAPDLARFRLTVDQLTATHSHYYPQTARWAEAIHTHHRDIDGLEWTSYRGGPARAFVLFGDRVAANDLASAGNEVLIRTSVAIYGQVIACGERLGVRVHGGPLP
jgi:RES domain